MKQHMSRRGMLRLSGAALIGVVAAACGATPTATPVPVPPTATKPAAAPTAAAAQPTAAPVAPTAAASKPAAAAATPTVVARKPVTLTIWTDPWGGQDMWKPIFAEAKEKLNITIDFTMTPYNDLQAKYFTAFAGGTAPDLMQGHPIFVPTFSVRKAIVDFTPYIEREKYDLNRFFPAALSTLAYLGRQYGLPGQYVFQVIYYNRKLMRDAGLTEPYDLWKQDKWTTDAYIEYANQLARGEGATQIYSTAEPAKTTRLQVSWLNMYGGAVYSDDLKKVVVNSPEALKGWELIADHVRKKWSPAIAGREGNYNATMEPLYNGNRLALFGNNRGFLNVIDAKIDTSMVPYPKGPTGQFSTRGIGQGFIASSKTQNPDACWEWLKFQAVRAYEVGLKAGATNPMYVGDFDTEMWKTALKPWEKNDVYVYSAAGARPDRLPPGFSEQDSIAEAAYDEVALGKKATVKEAMDPAAQKMQASLDNYYKQYGG